MGKLKMLVLALSFFVQLCAEPLADSLEILSQSLTALAGFLPKALPHAGKPEFSVYKDFDYAPGSDGIAQPKLRIGLEEGSGNLIVEGPVLDKSKIKKDMFRVPPGLPQSFRYPVDAATQVEWNDAGQLTKEGELGISTLYKKPEPGEIRPLEYTPQQALYDAFGKWKNSGTDFNIKDWWLESKAPKVAALPADAGPEPVFIAGTRKHITIAEPGKDVSTLIAIGQVPSIGIVPAADGGHDIVIYGPRLAPGTTPQDFVKDGRLVFPLEKTSIEWSVDRKKVAKMSPPAAFPLISAKEFAEMRENEKEAKANVEKIKTDLDAKIKQLKPKLDINAKTQEDFKNLVEANKGLARLVTWVAEQLAPLKIKEDRYGSSLKTLLDIVQSINELYGAIFVRASTNKRGWDDVIKPQTDNPAVWNVTKKGLENEISKGLVNSLFKQQKFTEIHEQLEAVGDASRALKKLENQLVKLNEDYKKNPLDFFYENFTSPDPAKVANSLKVWDKYVVPGSAAGGPVVGSGSESEEEDWD